jgi:hypothetical protein
MSGPLDNRWCACDATAAATCNLCGALLCRWHWADGPAETVSGVQLRPACLPACGAPMTRNWVADVQRWQEGLAAKNLRRRPSAAK